MARESEPTAIRTASTRYADADLGSSILSDDVLIDMLVRGVFSIDGIRECLNNSRHYTEQGAEAAWRTLWHRYDRTDDELNEARATVEKQFANREFVEPGVILHVFGMRLSLAQDRLVPQSVETIVEQCVAYVDDLLEAGTLSPVASDEMDDVRLGGYGGLAIFSADTEEFSRLFQYLADRRAVAYTRTLPGKAAVLMSEMASDVELFARRIMLTNGSDSIYYRTPILAVVSVPDFLAKFLGLHPSAQRTVVRALKSRFEGHALKRDLAAEVGWLRSLCDQLSVVVNKSPGFTAARISTWLPGLRSLLPDDAA